jgi:hypothetical protein
MSGETFLRTCKHYIRFCFAQDEVGLAMIQTAALK